ncbi:MAG: TonB-dependent receptor, partial [Opitutus sp.]
RLDGSDGRDSWTTRRVGFRTDWDANTGDGLTFLGEAYSGSFDVAGPENTTVSGGHLLGRWSRQLANNADCKVQLYYDYTHRRIPGSFTQTLDTYDLDAQYRRALGAANDFVCGFGYRLVQDDVINTPANAFLPPQVGLRSFNGFVQDEVRLLDDSLHLTFGSKLEHNDYTGFEVEPSVRFAWTFARNQTVWGAVSRAIRTPSRIDRDLYSPAKPPYRVAGSSNVVAEKLIAYELGYRVQLEPELAVSLAAFFNDYDDLRSLEPLNPPRAFPVQNSSGLRGRSTGAELTVDWRATSAWRWRAGWTELRVHSEPQAGNRDRGTRDSIARDPNHQFALRSMLDLSSKWECDVTARYVAPIRMSSVSGYTEADVRLGWSPSAAWEFSLIGQNLLHDQHVEFNPPGARRGQQRSVFGKGSRRF